MTDDKTAETGSAYARINCDNHCYRARARCPECKGELCDTDELGIGRLLAETPARVTFQRVPDGTRRRRA